MRILAFDCATKTGWCLMDGGRIIESGVQNFAKRRGESNGIMFMRFNKWIAELIEMSVPDVIAYEMAHFRGGSATEICVGLQTRVQESAVIAGVQYMSFTTSEIKKFACGKGNAKKPEMILAAVPFLGRQPIDDNEADAVHIARMADSEV